MLGITFIRNPIHGDVESPELLGRLHFNVPNRFTRNYMPLVLNHCSFNSFRELSVHADGQADGIKHLLHGS